MNARLAPSFVLMPGSFSVDLATNKESVVVEMCLFVLSAK